MMVSVMQKSEVNLVRIEDKISSPQDELEYLKKENLLLKNQIADHLTKDIAYNKAMESERKHVVLYLEEVSRRIYGIPAISNIIKDVISKIASGIDNGDHLKQETYDRR